MAVNMEQEVKRLNTRIRELEDALTNIREYNSMIPLHTEDAHALHFTEQVDAWCLRFLKP